MEPTPNYNRFFGDEKGEVNCALAAQRELLKSVIPLEVPELVLNSGVYTAAYIRQMEIFLESLGAGEMIQLARDHAMISTKSYSLDHVTFSD